MPALSVAPLSRQKDGLASPRVRRPDKETNELQQAQILPGETNELQQAQILPGEELPWFFPEEEFLRVRSAAY